MDNYGQYLREFSEYALRNEAHKAAQTISIRSYDNGSSKDTRRNSTSDEATIIENCIYGALLTIKSNATIEAQKPAMDTAEMIADLSISNINGYDSVYNPVLRICEDFKAVSLRARAVQSEYYYNGYNIDRLYDQGAEWWIHRNGGKTLGYEDGSIYIVRKSLEDCYVSADDLRREEAEAAEKRESRELPEHFEDIRYDDCTDSEAQDHPDFCYSNDINNNCTIIKWGESGYYRTDYPEGKYTDDIIDELNKKMGITPEQRYAMECCSIVAQDRPDLNWVEHYKMCLDPYVKDDEPILSTPSSDSRK